jgi:ribosomal protein L11 methyltransferase
MNHLQITFKPITKPIADILVALLADIGFDGFAEEENTLLAVIAETDFNETSFVETIAPFGIAYTKQTIAPRNWNAEWESSYDPIIINKEVAIRATFHAPITTSAHNIVIVPKMSFGTGHHATTQMMMEYISELHCTNKTVLDYGCGTGVLAIYASYKGASHADAIDIDQWCVENTQENIALNNSTNIDTHLGDIDVMGHKQYDIIFANINLHILLKQMNTLYSMLQPGGIALLSGFLDTDVHQLLECAQKAGFISTNKKQSLNWCALHITKL